MSQDQVCWNAIPADSVHANNQAKFEQIALLHNNIMPWTVLSVEQLHIKFMISHLLLLAGYSVLSHSCALLMQTLRGRSYVSQDTNEAWQSALIPCYLGH